MRDIEGPVPNLERRPRHDLVGRIEAQPCGKVARDPIPFAYWLI